MREYSKHVRIFIFVLITFTTACSHRHKAKSSLRGGLEREREYKTCGDSPNVEKSIENCNTSLTIKNTSWKLVHRSSGGAEVWADMTSVEKPMFWGPISQQEMSFEDAAEYCKQMNTATFIHEEGYSWTLPEFDHYAKAEVRGIRHVLPDMKHSFWTATYSSPFSVYLFDGTYASLKEADIKVKKPKHFVRCLYLASGL